MKRKSANYSRVGTSAKTKPVARRGALSRDTILELALKLIDEQGFSAFSMRQLGHALHVEAMSIYYYFESKEDILDGLFHLWHVKFSERLDHATIDDMKPEAVVRYFAQTYRDFARSHPGTFRVLAQRPITAVRDTSNVRVLMNALEQYGLKGENAIVAFHTILCFVSGFALLEAADAKPFYSTGDFDLEFNKGLDVVLTGIKRAL